MTIGGYDTVIKTNDPYKEIDKIKQWLNWSNAVVEIDEGESFFYYKDQLSKNEWDKFGLDPTTENNMIYFLIGSEYLTVVTDKELTDGIRKLTGGK